MSSNCFQKIHIYSLCDADSRGTNNVHGSYNYSDTLGNKYPTVFSEHFIHTGFMLINMAHSIFLKLRSFERMDLGTSDRRRERGGDNRVQRFMGEDCLRGAKSLGNERKAREIMEREVQDRVQRA